MAQQFAQSIAYVHLNQNIFLFQDFVKMHDDLLCLILFPSDSFKFPIIIGNLIVVYKRERIV